MLECSALVHHLQYWQPEWEPVWALAVLFPVLHFSSVLGKAAADGWSAWVPAGTWRTQKSFWLLVATRPSLEHWGHLWSESMDGRFVSVSPPSSVTLLSNKSKINLKIKISEIRPLSPVLFKRQETNQRSINWGGGSCIILIFRWHDLIYKGTKRLH